MFGFFCRQFSMAGCDWVCWPPPFATQAICLLFFVIPNPFRKPLCRSAPTEDPACSSSIAIVTYLPFVAALAYLPILMPALRLFVANSASTADVGLVGES